MYFLMIFFALIGTACTTSYPSAVETLAVFDSGKVDSCSDVITALISKLTSEGWEPGRPSLTGYSASVPLARGGMMKVIAVVNASKRWEYPRTVEHLGLCVSGENLGYVVLDTFKAKQRHTNQVKVRPDA